MFFDSLPARDQARLIREAKQDAARRQKEPRIDPQPSPGLPPRVMSWSRRARAFLNAPPSRAERRLYRPLKWADGSSFRDLDQGGEGQFGYGHTDGPQFRSTKKMLARSRNGDGPILEIYDSEDV